MRKLVRLLSGEGHDPGVLSDTHDPERSEFRPIDQFQADDVFIASYPRSGATWTQTLLAGLLYGLDLRLIPDEMVQDLVPDVHARRVYKRYHSPCFFKTHWLPRPEYRKVVHLVRDGRDVMVSYRHYLEGEQGKAAPLKELIETGAGLFPCKWHEHCAAWLENPHHADVLLIRYEDLLVDARAQLGRICKFAGVSRSDEQIAAAVEGASFTNSEERERRLGLGSRVWDNHCRFVRRGVSGSHRDEMTSGEQQLFESEAGSVLRQLGYTVESRT